MPIVGYRYSPIKDLTVETSAISGGCIIGESMSYDGLVVNVNRENGKSMTIDKDSYTQPSCREVVILRVTSLPFMVPVTSIADISTL